MYIYDNLSEKEIIGLQEIARTGYARSWARLASITVLSAILCMIYPYKIIIIWYTSMIVFDAMIHILIRRLNKLDDGTNFSWPKWRLGYFIASWLESISLAGLAIALSVHEGHVTHFMPYVILLCASLYVATNTFQSKTLMFGHVLIYNISLISIATFDVVSTFPHTDTILWMQFTSAVLIVAFLTDSYWFVYKIYLDRLNKTVELQISNKRAEKLTIQKSDLISAIGHELRTPLNGILGFTQILKRSELSQQQIESVSLIESAGKSLHLLLSNFQDSEALEQGRFMLRPAETNIYDVLDRTVKLFASTAEDKNLYLTLKIADDLPKKIIIDEIRLSQCISNLISNAIRFTKKGGITVRANLIQPDNIMTISVSDTGIGIPIEQTNKIFDKFVLGKNQSVQQTSTGMGLWLVQHIARAMDGRLYLLRTSSKGSKFKLEFKLPKMCHEHSLDYSALKDKRVLHIEDTETNLVLMRLWLEEQGMIVTEARNAHQAIDSVRKYNFDVMLCDYHLPDLQGNQLLQKIRMMKNTNALIPVIAITAQPEKIKNQTAVRDFDAVLSKPVNHKQMLSVLINLLINHDKPKR